MFQIVEPTFPEPFPFLESHLSVDRIRSQRKGATSKKVKNRQKCFRHFSTFSAQGKTCQKSPKSVKTCSTLFGPFRAATVFLSLLLGGGGSESNRSDACSMYRTQPSGKTMEELSESFGKQPLMYGGPSDPETLSILHSFKGRETPPQQRCALKGLISTN